MPTVSAGKEHTRYVNVQALRAVAALMVVAYHVVKILHDRTGGAFTGNFHAGAAGVDLFFCISGFVIVTSSADIWGKSGSWAFFLWRRVVRIVPLYWLATLLKLVLVLALPGLAQRHGIDAWHTAASFLMIPAWDADGTATPLLPQGWTLSFEMLFYLLFAVMLARSVRPVGRLTAVLMLLSAIGLLRTPAWGAVATLLNPLLLEFAFGMWVATLTLHGVYLRRGLAKTILLLTPFLLLAGNQITEEDSVRFGVLLWGIPGALVLMSAVALESESPGRPGLSGQLGDASYAIYLFHGFLVQSAVAVLLTLHMSAFACVILSLILGILVSSVAGVLIHRRIEKPLLKRLHRFDPLLSPVSPQPDLAAQGDAEGAATTQAA